MQGSRTTDRSGPVPVSVGLATVHDGVDAPLDVGHLLQHLVDGDLVTLQTHVLRDLGEEESLGGRATSVRRLGQ